MYYYNIAYGVSSKIARREFFIFIIFSDISYTCSYVVFKVWADSDQNWIFLQILKVAPKLGQRPCTIVHGPWPNFIKNGKERILHFYNFFWYIYMYLCCVESLSWFWSYLDFLRIFKVAQKLGKSACTIVQGLGPNFIKIVKERILHFYIFFWYIYMYLCCV